MIRLAILPLLLTFGLVHADDHMPTAPIIAQIYECSLNENVTPAQVAALGSGEFNKFVTKNKINMNSYLWEAVAINAPYDDADLRWVNYFPTWKDQSNADRLWRDKGTKLQGKIYELITCKKPFFFPMQNVAQPPMAEPLARRSLEALTQLMLRQTGLRAALALQQPPSQDRTMRLCLWYSPDRAAELRERRPSRSTKDSTPAGAAGSATN